MRTGASIFKLDRACAQASTCSVSKARGEGTVTGGTDDELWRSPMRLRGGRQRGILTGVEAVEGGQAAHVATSLRGGAGVVEEGTEEMR